MDQAANDAAAITPTDRSGIRRYRKWSEINHKSRPQSAVIGTSKEGPMTDEDDEDRLGRYQDKVFKYTPPKDVGGPPLWVAKFDEDIWLGYTEQPKNLGDLTEKYRHMVREGRAINRRLKMGEWIRERKPSNEELLTQQVFLEMLDPVPYDEIFDDTEETPEGQAVLEQVDMAVAVIEAGGACTVCGVEPDQGHVHHKVGCYLPGFAIWRMLHPEDADRTPSLAMVIQAAQEQIARMQ